MSTTTSVRKTLAAAGWIGLAAQPSLADNKLLEIYTFSDTPIKEFQNKRLHGSIVNDRKVLLGSIGSDLWHGPKDPRDELWMIADRGPNGQFKVDGTNRRTFWKYYGDLRQKENQPWVRRGWRLAAMRKHITSCCKARS